MCSSDLLSPKFAMKIGKRATLAELDLKGWNAFASDAGIGMPLVRRRIGEISDSVKTRAQAVAGALVAPGLDAAALVGFAMMVTERSDECARSVSG